MENKLNIKYVKTKSHDNQCYIGAFLENQLIGFLRYKFNNGGNAWLYFVGVKREYRHLKNEQIGSSLMRIFENECHRCRIWDIEGKYWPKGEEGDVVKRFYLRNGYQIIREDYDLLVSKQNPKKYDLSFDVEDMEYEKFELILNDYLNHDEDELAN